MRNIIIYVFLGLAVACWGRTYSVSEIPNVQLQDYTKLLSNPDGIISPEHQARIDSLLLDARRRTSAEIAAVAVEDIDTDDIDGFATKLFNSWGLGKADKNNGILILLARDSRQVTIRTGRGADGILPDILAGRIIRQQMIPQFSKGDYSQGLLDGVAEVHRLVTDPEAVAELMSKERDNYSWSDDGDFDLFKWYLYFCYVIGGLVTFAVIGTLIVDAKKTPYQKYISTEKFLNTCVTLTVMCLLIPMPPTFLLFVMRKRWRNKTRVCPQCGAKMCKLDEDTDNQYLNMAQDLEEKLNSVDYDVWLCPQCGETDIYSYVNKDTPYKECPNCHTHALKLSGTRVLIQPTTQRKGKGEKIYTCLHCKQQSSQRYDIDKKMDPATASILGSILSGGSGGGGHSRGGGFGGGFGGGSTGGGGATGRW